METQRDETGRSAHAFSATRRELLIATSQKMAKKNDIMFAADSLLHGSMTQQARDGPVTLMPSSGAQMGFTLAPRDINDRYNPKVDQWRQNLRTRLHQCLAGCGQPL